MHIKREKIRDHKCNKDNKLSTLKIVCFSARNFVMAIVYRYWIDTKGIKAVKCA